MRILFLETMVGATLLWSSKTDIPSHTLKARMAAMSIDEALKTVKPEAKGLFQSLLTTGTGDIKADVENATEKLNSMLLNLKDLFVEENDVIQRAKDAFYKQYNSLNAQLNFANRSMSSAEEEESQALMNSRQATDDGNSAKDLLLEHSAEWEKDYKVLKEELDLTQQDSDGYRAITDQMKCDPESPPALLQCKIQGGSGGKDKQSYYTVNNSLVTLQISKLKTPAARKAMQVMLKQIYHSSDKTKLTLLQKKTTKRRHHAKHQVTHLKTSNQASAQESSSANPGSKCTLAGNAKCTYWKTKILAAKAEIDDMLYHQRTYLEGREKEDKETRKIFNDQIQSCRETKDAALLEMNKAATEKLQWDATAEKLSTAYEGMLDEKNRLESDHAALQQRYLAEKCGLKTIRQKIYENNALTNIPVDCEVGEWSEGECSATCGTEGTMLMERTILMGRENMGMECPELQKTGEHCNRINCPVDCQMGEWSEWSTCTKPCGTGATTRNRNIERDPVFGGITCEATEESEKCNTDSCDKDCELSLEWSRKTNCSKACNTGFQEHHKIVLAPSKGNGTCPPHSEMTPCNERIRCGRYLTSNEEIDLVIMIDGSGNMRPRTFRKVVKWISMMAQRFNPNNVSLIISQFSGPDTSDLMSACEGGHGELPPAADCGVPAPAMEAKAGTWVAEDVRTQLKGMKRLDKGYASYKTALTKARQFLEQSRASAQSVVLVIGRGAPDESDTTQQEAESLQAQGITVKFAPIGGRNKRFKNKMKESVKRWVSRPVRDNLHRLWLGRLGRKRGQRALSRFIATFGPKAIFHRTLSEMLAWATEEPTMDPTMDPTMEPTM